MANAMMRSRHSRRSAIDVAESVQRYFKLNPLFNRVVAKITTPYKIYMDRCSFARRIFLFLSCKVEIGPSHFKTVGPPAIFCGLSLNLDEFCRRLIQISVIFDFICSYLIIKQLIMKNKHRKTKLQHICTCIIIK